MNEAVLNVRMSKWMNDSLNRISEKYGLRKSDIVRIALIRYIKTFD